LHRITWYTGTCDRITMGLLYELNLMVTKVTWYYDWPWIQWLLCWSAYNLRMRVTVTILLVAWATWGQIWSGCYYMTVYAQYLGQQCYITGPSKQCQPCRKMVNILCRPYGRHLWLNFVCVCVYIYSIFLHIKILLFFIRIMPNNSSN
jgi:hypothetical protein